MLQYFEAFAQKSVSLGYANYDKKLKLFQTNEGPLQRKLHVDKSWYHYRSRCQRTTQTIGPQDTITKLISHCPNPKRTRAGKKFVFSPSQRA